MPQLDQFTDSKNTCDITITECAGGYIVYAAECIGSDEDEFGITDVIYDVQPHVFTDKETMFVFIGKALDAIRNAQIESKYPEVRKQ